MGERGVVSSYLNWNFYLSWCAHLFWAALAGVLLWYTEIWPAGDAKFFILVCAWLPLINPLLKNFPGYLFLSVLVNIFVAAALAAVGGFLASGFYKVGPADFFKELAGDIKKHLAGLAATKTGKWAVAAYLVNMTFLFLLQQILNSESRHFLSRFLARTDIVYFPLLPVGQGRRRVYRQKMAAGYYGLLRSLFLRRVFLFMTGWPRCCSIP